jgi:hypothetical protein
MRFEHPNGITLMLPRYLVADPTSTGFLVSTPQSRFLRIPEEVSVDLRADAREPKGEWPSTRDFDERVIYFRVDMEEGGSGGSTYILSAWETTQDGYIEVKQHTQAEGLSSPDFSLAWKVIEHMELTRE